jgi:hypothetical protein
MARTDAVAAAGVGTAADDEFELHAANVNDATAAHVSAA